MKPTQVKDNSQDFSRDESDGGYEDDLHEPSRKKTKKPKLPPGLSLMQGFNAQNVGKLRLTVRFVGGFLYEVRMHIDISRIEGSYVGSVQQRESVCKGE